MRGSEAIAQKRNGSDAGSAQDKGRKRDQYDEAECGNGEAKRQPETGDDTWFTQAREEERHFRLVAGLVDQVKDSAIGKVGFLGLGPTAERIVDGDQIKLGEPGEICRVRRSWVRWPEIMFGGQLLPFRRIEELQIGFGYLGVALGLGVFINSATGGSALMESVGTTISNLSAPNSFECKERFVFPGNQHIANFTLNEGCG